MWRVERKRRAWKPYEWMCFFSSAGMAGGRAWTRRGAEKALLKAQSWLLNS